MMNSTTCIRRRLPEWLAAGVSLVLAAASVAAQAPAKTAAAASAAAQPAAADTPFTLRGVEFDGRAFDLAQLRGRAVLVFYWSTDCSVCMNKWPELRANAMGWRNKPFTLVSVNVDRTPAAWRDYERLVADTKSGAGFVRVWASDPAFADSLTARPQRLPLTLVLDRQGKVALRIEGRIAPEAWDSIADLLP